MSGQTVCQHNIRLPADEGRLTWKTARSKLITIITKPRKSPKRVEIFFSQRDAELLKGLPPKMPLACEVVGFRHVAVEIGMTSMGAGHYLWWGRAHLPEDMNCAQNQAQEQLGGEDGNSFDLCF